MFGLMLDKNKKIPEGKSEACFRVGTHQTVTKELVLKKANGFASHRLRHGKKVALEHTGQTTANSQLACMLALA